MTFAPFPFGRSVVVGRGQTPPEPWHDLPNFCVDRELLTDPDLLGRVVAEMHLLWATRSPYVVVLDVDESALRVPESVDTPPWELDPEFTFLRERLFHLIWANTYDARRDPPIWWWASKAARVGSRPGVNRDVTLLDGSEAWIDGGPRGALDPDLGAVVHAETVTMGSLRVEPRPVDEDTGDLADDQRAAVMHPGGPARVIAPAGSGKTRTLAARLEHLVGRGTPPEMITAVAYNNRAARELRTRLPESLRGTVKTIHALGRSILISGRGELRLLDEREVRQRLERLIPVQPRPNTDVIGPYVEALSDIRVALRPPRTVEAERDDVPDLDRVQQSYRRGLRDRNECDFDEFVIGAIEVLLSDSKLRERWQWTCRHLLVDEFQDLTPGYLLLLRLLASPTLDVFGVGDDDQVIYGHAGADPRFLIEFDRLFPGASLHALEVNYRCPPAIITAARTLLSYNHRRIDKEIKGPAGHGDDHSSDDGGGLEVVVDEGARGAIETADRVVEWLESGINPVDIVVLCRVNSALLPVHAALVDRQVGIISPLGIAALSRTLLAAALAWMRLASADDLSRGDLLASVRRPSRGITRVATDLLGRRRSVTLAELRQLGRDLDGRRADRWDSWCDDIGVVQRVAVGRDVTTLVDSLINDVGLDRAAAALDGGRARADRAAHSDDLHALIRLAALHPEMGDFETWLNGVVAVPSVADGVTLTTIHRVKGLEWDNVIVYGADRSLMPHDLADDVEEERRIFHVALTRARRRALVVADRDRPSRFLAELAGTADHGPPEIERPETARPALIGINVEIGDEIIVSGGYRGVVERRIPTGILVELRPGPGRLAITWGESITVTNNRGANNRGPLAPSAVQPDPDLVTKLKTWRSQTARTGGVPAYVILTDATIAELATRRPRSEQELLTIKGIGPSKLEAYGDDLLDLCSG